MRIDNQVKRGDLVMGPDGNARFCISLRWILAGIVLFLLTTRSVAQTGPALGNSSLGINLAGPADWNTEYPFVDVFHFSRAWISQRRGESWGKGPELKCDAHGWVTELQPDCWAETPLLTSGHAPSGEYVCLYDGEGEIEFHHNCHIVSREPGRIVVEIDGLKGGVFLQIRQINPTNLVRNIRVIMPGFESSYDRQIFTPTFLERWQHMNTFRFMDWMETNGSEQREWKDRPLVQDCNWTEKGIPIEIMVELCNRQQVNPWFCMPHLATDDYVREFARLVKLRLNPSLKIYIEYSNEVWNSMFSQTQYAGREGIRLGFGDKPWEAGWCYSAHRSIQIHRIWEEVFGDNERLVRVIATQAANPHVTRQKLEFNQAAAHFDALAIAPYFGMNISPEGSKLIPAADQVAAWNVERLLEFVQTNSLPRATESMHAQRQIAEEFQLSLICYEAGQHLVGVGGGENNEQLTALLQSANRHPRMGPLYTRYLDDWKESGGLLCCLFSSVGSYSKWGSWGLLEFAEQAGSPKFDAVAAWNRDHPR